MKRILVIIPTYNEADNILPLIAQITKISKTLRNYSLDILVLDDESPDGTAKLVKNLQKTNKKVYLSSGKKAGLGRAYIRGFKEGIKLHKYFAFITMDADFSHDPIAIPSLLSPLEDGADFVIGSRYISGGTTSGWPVKRRFTSWSANIIAKILLDLTSDIKDLTGGYKAMKVSALKTINMEDIRASGYVFTIILLNEFAKRGFDIREAPITFTNRKRGVSKMRLNDVLEFAYLSYRLNPNSRARRIIRFSLVGACGTLVNLAVLTSLVKWAHTPVLLADAVAIEASIISNFTLNHLYTFRAAITSPRFQIKEPISSVLIKLAKYNLITLGGAAISFGAFVLGYKWLGIHYILADIIAIILATGWNYWLSTRLVWKVVDEI